MNYLLTIHILLTIIVIGSPFLIFREIKRQREISDLKQEKRYVVNNITGERVQVSNRMTKNTMYIVLAMLSCIMFISFCTVVCPFLLDCGYILNNGIPKVSGIISEEILYGNKERVREKIVIEQQNGEKIELNVEASDKKRGDYITVEYLPHLKIGVITD